MTNERAKTLRTGRNIGAAIGGLVFLIFGITPAFFFGSAGTIMLLSHLVGGPVEPGIIVRMIMVVGTALGLVCVASVSIVVGSVLGTTLAWATESAAELLRPAPEKATVKVGS